MCKSGFIGENSYVLNFTDSGLTQWEGQSILMVAVEREKERMPFVWRVQATGEG